MSKIHPTAVIMENVKIGNDVEIGPFTVIQSNVTLGDGCYIDSHVTIGHDTEIGARCRIYHGALVGVDPQDHRFDPNIPAKTVIGSDTVIREYVTIHRSPFENGETRIGNHVLLMGFVHIGHDCRISDRVTIANSTAVSGHCEIGEGAVLSGYILIHQFSRIGALAMVSARTLIVQDIPPFCLLAENNHIFGVNTVGLRRNDISSDDRAAIKRAVRLYFYSGMNGSNAMEEIAKESGNKYVDEFLAFIKAGKRGIMPGDPGLIRKVEED